VDGVPDEVHIPSDVQVVTVLARDQFGNLLNQGGAEFAVRVTGEIIHRTVLEDGTVIEEILPVEVPVEFVDHCNGTYTATFLLFQEGSNFVVLAILKYPY
jgi:hypothetical protein